jgi:parallel beta-helix repeat protein/predicted outer membrane repeat protein
MQLDKKGLPVMLRMTFAHFLRTLRQSSQVTRRTRRLPRRPETAIVEKLESRVMLSAATVVTVAASSLTPTSATIGGDVTSDGGSAVTERGIIFSLTEADPNPTFGGDVVTQIADVGIGTGPFSIPLAGLSPFTTYSYVAYAINGDGSSVSTVSTFKTNENPSFVVTTASDIVDPTDGLTSLREALDLANSTPGADAITFDGPVFTDQNPDTIDLSLGQLTISDSVTISGTGASNLTIDANGTSRVFYLFQSLATIDVTLSGMTITGGNANIGGGIKNLDESLTLVDSVVTGNSSSAKGGGLWADGFNMTLTIRRSVISNNTSGDDGGGIYVEDTGGLLTIEDTTISGNHTSGDGGGIYFYDPDDNMVISRSTISGNTADGRGGGIYLYSMDGGTFTIENSTISGNQAAAGGGIFFYGVDTPMVIRNSTIAFNAATNADAGGGAFFYGSYSGSMSIVNTIIAGNKSGGTLETGTPDDIVLLNGNFGTFSNNLISTTPSPTTLNGATLSGNIFDVDPLLQPLANNGGYTQTHALAQNSQAINNGTTTGAPALDQRGVTRDTQTDIGAYEASPPAITNVETSPLQYNPGEAAKAITSTLTLSDPDSANLAGATIQVSAGYQAGDTLAFANTANITGFYNTSTGTLTLTGTDTVANYQAALRSITYTSTTDSPATRTISFQATDGTYTGGATTRDVGGFAQLVGTTVNVFGTSIVNNISVSEGATLDVTVDGVLTQFTPAQVTSIFIFGFGGDDSVVINSLIEGTALTVYGMSGNDSIVVNAAVTQGVTLSGEGGNDLLIGGSGNDLLLGSTGDDWLNGGDGYDLLVGGDGNDVYEFSDTTVNQIDTVSELSGEGIDILNFSALTTSVTADLTSDTALVTTIHQIVQVASAGQSADFENVFGGSVDDFITGNAANNLLIGNAGNDTLNGGDGNDQLEGREGNDLLQGGNQDDVLIGGIGDDYLNGDAGNDLLDGDDGFNVLAGGQDDDRYLFFTATVNQIDTVLEQSEGGIDTLDFAAIATTVTVDLTSDSLTATMDHRIVQSGAGLSANLENVIGGSNNDQITGNSANNLLAGNGGDDTIAGGGGNDVLLGGQGNDVLQGISGRNILFGGPGGDVLQGGTGDDLLLSGSSIYESDPDVLAALMAEWSSGNTYQMRVDHLKGDAGGGANTSFILTSSTVTSDADADYLTGSGGQDWFLANSLQDPISDQAVNETFTHIDAWV